MRYIYSCAKCNGSVSKPAVSADKDGKVVHGLHGWKCSSCGPTSVKRSMNKDSE